MTSAGNLEVEVIAEAQVKKSESKDKVAQAVLRIFPISGDIAANSDNVRFVSRDIECLRFIKDQFRDRQVRAAARRLLLSSIGQDHATLLLNKQAATAGIAALCDDPRESQLGPIVLSIRSNNLLEVIEWITAGYATSGTS